ncbi:ABC transporter permease [candidate division KSB1 bacterium]|nr:ABC transporter permease [candidate division KSB1 bacterium]
MRFLIELWEGFKIALVALRSNKLRTFLTTLGIVIGIMTVITIHAIIIGLNDAFYESISSLGSDTLYIQKFSWGSREDWLKALHRKDITVKEAEEIEEYATLVSAVAPTVYASRTVKYGSEKLTRMLVIGTNADYVTTSNTLPEYGRPLSDLDVDNRRYVCVIGYEIADKLFKNTNPLGRRITIGLDKFRVIGVLEERGTMLGDNMDARVIIPIGLFQKLYGSRRWVTIEVKVSDPALMDEAKDEITGILRRARRVPPQKENDFAINEQSLISDLYNNLTGALYAVAFGVGAISLIVGGIGVMNIMLVSVTERTREIGIRKALGARNKDILWQFLVESIAVSAVGGAIGIIIGFLLAKLIASATFLSASISMVSIIIGLVFIALVGITFGLFPAYKAARQDPIAALRYE